MLGLTQPGFKEIIIVLKGPPLTFGPIGLMNFDLICVHSNSVPGSNDRWSVLTSTPQSAPRLRRRWSGPCAAPSLTGQAFWRLLPCAAQYHANLGQLQRQKKISKWVTKVSKKKDIERSSNSMSCNIFLASDRFGPYQATMSELCAVQNMERTNFITNSCVSRVSRSCPCSWRCTGRYISCLKVSKSAELTESSNICICIV